MAAWGRRLCHADGGLVAESERTVGPQFEFTAVTSRYAQGDHCLVPGYEEVKTKQLMEFRSPRDMAGAKMLTKTYVDHYKEDNGWMYMPAQRKPRRTLASERTSEVMGMDFIMEDFMGFGGKVYEHTWSYLGKEAGVGHDQCRDQPGSRWSALMGTEGRTLGGTRGACALD